MTYAYSSKEYEARFSNQKTRKNSNYKAKDKRNYFRPVLVEMMLHAQQMTDAMTNYRWLLKTAHLEGLDPLQSDKLIQDFCLSDDHHLCIICIQVDVLFYF